MDHWYSTHPVLKTRRVYYYQLLYLWSGGICVYTYAVDKVKQGPERRSSERKCIKIGKSFHLGLLITFFPVHLRMFPLDNCGAECRGQSPPTATCHPASPAPVEADHYTLLVFTNPPFWQFLMFLLQP